MNSSTDSMLAIIVDDQKGLSWAPVDRAPLAADEVRLRIHATAVNRADLLQRAGRYPVPKGASPILGLEAAGEVAAVGAQVTGVSVGDRACVLLEGGGYAESVDCHPGMLLSIPDGMSYAEAAALPEVFATAYLNLFVEGAMQPGETALIHAAGSGVGTAALQLCRARGHRTFATASGDKLDALKPLGADVTIDRRTASFRDVVREATDGRGVDVILDCVGGAYLDDNVASLAVGGRLVIIGLLGGATAELNIGALLMRRLRVIGSVLRSRSRAEKLALMDGLRADVWPHVATGALRPIIDRVLPITDVEAAHEALKSNETIGKVVLTVP